MEKREGLGKTAPSRGGGGLKAFKVHPEISSNDIWGGFKHPQTLFKYLLRVLEYPFGSARGHPPASTDAYVMGQSSSFQYSLYQSIPDGLLNSRTPRVHITRGILYLFRRLFPKKNSPLAQKNNEILVHFGPILGPKKSGEMPNLEMAQK